MGRERLTLGVLAVLLGLVPLVSSALPAQVPPADSIRISISSGDGKAQAPTLLNGFLRALHGQTIPYHSSHPDANQALICRTRSDMLSISWETDTVRGPAEQGSYRFIWLAGMDFGGFGPSRAPRTFHLAVNGTEWFVFRNRKDSTAHRWTETGPAGATLEFRSTLTDQYGDLFGEMTMTVPEGRCVPGVPIRIDVRAEDAGLPDWYMTMAYTFAFTCSARCEPVLLNEQGAPAQLVRVSLDNLHPGRRIVIERPGRRMIDTLLQVGANALLVSVRPVGRVTDLPILVTVDGRTASAASVRMTPVRHREIYLLSYSHNDIGYSDPQPVVLKKQWSYLERALDLIRRTKDFPVEAQYRWNVEILWPFMSFLEQADESRRAEIVGAVRDGHLGLNAYYANVLTGIAQPVEMSHSFDQARALRTQYGFPMETALITDIPGFTWGIVTALAHAGVKYFAMAPNAYDRIGYAYELWGDKPFWWMSQSGEERVLAWLAGASYSSFHDGSLSQRGDEKMFSVLRALEERSPFSDIIQMPYTINGDNGPPDELLPEFVRSWNARYVSPRLIIATHEQMFKALVADSGDSLKTVAGDFTPYWEDGVFSTAREAELTRSSVNRLIQAEALWAMRAPRLFPDALSREAWRNVTLWDEHTWGAWNSITEPDAPAVRAQWEYKRRFALESDRQSRELLGLASAPRSGMSDRFIDVVNTHSWRRSDLVILTAARSAGVRGVRSWDDRPVPAQRLTTGELAFSATDVPPLGSRRYVLVRRGKDPGGSAWADGLTVGNEFLTLRVDSVTGGIVSLVRRRVRAMSARCLAELAAKRRMASPSSICAALR